ARDALRGSGPGVGGPLRRTAERSAGPRPVPRRRRAGRPRAPHRTAARGPRRLRQRRGRPAAHRPRRRPGGGRSDILGRHEQAGRRGHGPGGRGGPRRRAPERLAARAPPAGGVPRRLRPRDRPPLVRRGRGRRHAEGGAGGGLGGGGNRAVAGDTARGAEGAPAAKGPARPAPEERCGAGVASGLFTRAGAVAAYLSSVWLLEPHGLLAGPNNLFYLTVVGA